MRCLVCQALSSQAICKKCQKNLLEPSFYKRELEKDFFVYSFYTLDEIKDLINAKYYFYGDRVFNILGKLTFKKFTQNFEYTHKVTALPIDDRVKEYFSHTAILTKYLNSSNIKPTFNTIYAKNNVKYAGQSLEYRQKNKRDFGYSGAKDLEVILVDDVVTTGTTILEAKKVLEKNGCKALFALTLSDAKNETKA